MPIIFVHLHHIIHTITGGLDCLILLIVLAPYFAYRVFIKKDFDVKKFLKKGKECNCKEHKFCTHKENESCDKSKNK